MKKYQISLSQKSSAHAAKWFMVSLMLTAAGWGTSCKDEYDLDEKLPPNFGSNLMTYLESNDFQNYRQLVKDLGYDDALSGVSLKTLFAANDEAFARFYASNPWGVKSYEELTDAQKKMLLYGSMLDNSLQVMNLSSTTGTGGVVTGNAMRRFTASSYYDSVPQISVDEMPDNGKAWEWYRKNNKAITCLKDMTTAPVMFLTENFLENQKITDDDVNFTFNYVTDRKTGDAYVGNTYIADPNIRCANGFIHRTNDVLVPLDNMAEMIRKNPKTTIFSRLLERFSAPYYVGREATTSYNYEYGTDIDSLFQKRYFSERSQTGPLRVLPSGKPVEATLSFDPGWNAYYSDDPNALTQTVAVQENMGVMLVPTDSAMIEYWNEGVGKTIKDYYGDWDNVPDNVVSKLINNCMLNSWVNSVPSKFSDVMNSNQDPMKLTKEAVERVDIACNGAIYLTKEVFSPTEYVSVSFPALINQSMSVIYWAIEQLEYRSYLNSLDSYYSFFIPTNEGMLTYWDPVKYTGIENELWRFHYDPKADTPQERVWASVFLYNMETGAYIDSLREERDYGKIKDRLEDILDNHIVVGNRDLDGNVENGHEYYRTKNGGVIRMKNVGGQLYVQGTLQMDQNKWLPVTQTYDESQQGNGKTYILGIDPAHPETEPILTTRKSTFDVLQEHPEFSRFFELLSSTSLYETDRNGLKPASDAGNVSVFKNYNYTVYVPSNESIDKLITDGVIPSPDELAEDKERLDNGDPSITQELYDAKVNKLESFLRYHIQDNLLMIGLDYSNDGVSNDTFTRKFETAIMDETSKKFFTLDVSVTPTDIKLKDNVGNVRTVQKIDGLYNIPVREYLIQWGSQISASSFAAIHLIDGPLLYK